MTRFVAGEVAAQDGSVYATVYREIPNAADEGQDYGYLERLSREELETLLERLIDGHKRCNDETDYCYVCDCHPTRGHAADCPLRDE